MDLERIEELIESIQYSKVCEVSVKQDGASVLVKKSPVCETRVEYSIAPEPSYMQPEPAEPEQSGEITVTAPMVGIFHLIDGIGEIGTVVRHGQAIGAIESMKLMNEIRCSEGGLIKEILVEDGMPVEYGQVLFRLEKN